MTQKEYIGPDSILCLREVLAKFGSRRIFLITGKTSYSASGAKAYLGNLLNNYEVRRFCEFAVNPKIEDIDHGIDVFRASQCDTIIAVGGGSVIDMAKAIDFLAAHPSTVGEYKLRSRGSEATVRPLVAIPTTSGSGSEATRFATMYVGKQKHSIVDERILPAVVIVDANLTMSMSRYTTAVSGLDAMGQAIESYWSIHSTSGSKEFAGNAIELIVANLPVAVKNPTVDSRIKMAEAAHLAGKAINITKTTAAHSISYPLTAYFGIPHGHAVGVTLSSLLVFNANVTDDDVLDKRGTGYVRDVIHQICELLGASSASDAKDKIDAIIHDIGLERRLNLLALREREDIETIVENGFDPDRVNNNPRRLMRDALRQILEQIY